MKWVWRFGPILIVALILPGLANWFTRVDLDNLQPQWSTPAGYPNRPSRLVQSFVAHQPGLEAIELTAAVYGANGDSRRAQTGQIVFRLRKALDTSDLATWVLPAPELVHNDPVYFRFNPQWESKGQRFFLVIELPSVTSYSEPISSFWSALTDVYPEGDLSIDQQVLGDLTFKTYYRYSLETIGADVAWLFPWLGFVFLICLFLWSPGYLLGKILSLNLALLTRMR